MRKIIYEKEELKLDNGSYFGQGVFETILWLDKPIFLKEHIERLKEGMEKIGLAPLEEEDELLKFIDSLEVKNKAFKIMVTPLNIVLRVSEIPYKEEDYKKGRNLKISKVLRNSTSILSYIKSSCYIENIIEKRKAVKEGFDDVLFFNENGFLSETSCANIFIIKNNRIFTPKIENGLLRGIIRTWVINNFSVEEGEILYEDLKDADEVFVTNSLMGIMRVNKIEDITYGESSVLDNIINKYNDAIH